MKKGLLLLPLLPLAYAQDYQIHILNSGDTLSGILKEKGFTPLWGKGNWVDKVLEMNHMKLSDASKIKKGLPLILPKEAPSVAELDLAELEKDFVSMKDASYIRTGIFGNTISDHQKVFIELDYYTSDMILSSDTVSLNENYGLGIRVDGENDYLLGTMKYNFNGSAFIYTHGTGQFENIDNTSASFAPTYVFKGEIEINAPEVDFNFGPTLMVEERSRLFTNANEISSRRDRSSWLGFQFNKIMEIDHLRYEFTAGARRNVINLNQNNIEGNNFNASQVYLNSKVNLTHDYDLSVNFSQIQYENIGLERENTIGANLSYNIQ